MDDKELIKRIMEEVKDEKLREELLGLVVEKNRKQSEIKQEEQPIDYVSKQEILFGATEGVSKVGWWISLGISIVLILVAGYPFTISTLYLLFVPAEERSDTSTAIVFAVGSGFLLLFGLAMFFTLLSGKREYERFKRKRENQEKS
jgi:high-affinity nickel permease